FRRLVFRGRGHDPGISGAFTRSNGGCEALAPAFFRKLSSWLWRLFRRVAISTHPYRLDSGVAIIRGESRGHVDCGCPGLTRMARSQRMKGIILLCAATSIEANACRRGIMNANATHQFDVLCTGMGKRSAKALRSY